MKVYIDDTICKGCGICIYNCPKKVIRFSVMQNRKGFTTAEVYKIENCIGCKLCEIGCPDFAIYVEKEATESEEAIE
jgi:2-oxoglutarate ferredoxin oxidoreductase subunit delta